LFSFGLAQDDCPQSGFDCDVICQWFEGNEVHEESFRKEALRKVELVTAGGSRRADGVFMVS